MITSEVRCCREADHQSQSISRISPFIYIKNVILVLSGLRCLICSPPSRADRYVYNLFGAGDLTNQTAFSLNATKCPVGAVLVGYAGMATCTGVNLVQVSQREHLSQCSDDLHNGQRAIWS
jgi:hypothetical protein